MSYEMDDVKKIGIGLTGFGVLFSFLGVIFVFDKGLLAMGNILFLCGLALTIGIKSTVQFFTTPQHYKGTIAFVIGFFVLIVGWTFVGMLLEGYGFFVLFSGFWPTAKAFLYKVPVLGWLLHHPFLAFISDRFGQRRVAV